MSLDNVHFSFSLTLASPALPRIIHRAAQSPLCENVTTTTSPFCFSLYQETEPNYQDLMRILISRSETDLLSIRAEFKKKFGKSLYSSLQVRLGWFLPWSLRASPLTCTCAQLSIFMPWRTQESLVNLVLDSRHQTSSGSAWGRGRYPSRGAGGSF